MHDARPAFLSLLARLDPFFQPPVEEEPAPARSLLAALPALRAGLQRTERRAVVVGALKTGKSSVINALIGAPILPASSIRSHGAVVTLRYGSESTAAALDPDGESERAVRLEQVTSALMDHEADLSHLRIDVPLPLFPRPWTLVDTPGVLGAPEWSERTYRELEAADLAIMVLAADKILSAHEREVARRIADLLGGNVVWVVNRLDQVDEDERGEVLEWARRGLAPLVQPAVPQIFPATACRPDGFGIPELREWLERQATTPTGEARAVLARLGILEQAVRRMVDGLRDLHHSAEARHRQVRAAEDAALDEERREIRRKIGEGRLRLGSIRAGLAALGERFVATCLADTEASLGDRPSQVRIASDAALHAYQDDLTDAVRAVTLDLPATVPDFDLTGWRLRAEVAAADSLTSDMGTMLGDLATRVFDGGKAGREAGASLGDWIGKNVFGVDARRETMQRVEHVVRGVLPSLQRETERYLDTVEHLLAQAEEFYASWTRTAPQVMAAEAELQGYDRLLAWSDGFLEAIQDLVREIESSLR